MRKMKKLLFCLLAALIVCASLVVPALADETYIYDAAGVLTSSEYDTLEARAAEISGEYDCAVYIVTVEDHTEYGSGDVRAVAEAIYTESGFGLGADGSGVMLLLSMEDRDYALIARGYGNTVFTDYGKERLEDEFLDDFRRDGWYQGFADYISYSGTMLEQARNGEPPDVYSAGRGGSVSFSGGLRERLGVFGVILVVVIVPALIALIVCSIAKRNMKSVKKAEKADFFAVPGSMELRISEDRFSHVTETRVKVESDSDRDHGGGGGTSVDSSGFSGRSGKF